MTVYFHANFGLNRPIMSKLLKLALENPDLRDKELAAEFEYRAPFSARYRAWLNKTGFIEQGFPVTLTAEGQRIFEVDSEFEKVKTMHFMHEHAHSAGKNERNWN